MKKITALSEDNQVKDYYLKDGPMTQQFLNDPKLDAKMMKAKTDHEKIENLYKYINTKTFSKKMQQFFKKEQVQKFGRTAEEIWDNKVMTGCTDYALVFFNNG